MRIKQERVRVRARGGILVMDEQYGRESGGRRGYIGRYAVPAWKIEDLPDDEPCHIHTPEFLEHKEKPIPHIAYPKTGGAVEIDATPYVKKMVRNGSLWPADVESAALCGVQFDPTFGGEVEPLRPPRKARTIDN